MPEINNEPRFSANISLEKFKADFMEHGPVPSLARYYGVSPGEVFTLAIQYNLSIRKLNSERVRYKAKKAYDVIVAKLGHHPTRREMLQDEGSKNIFYAVKRLFGTLDKFKITHGYPLPEKQYKVNLHASERALELYKDYVELGMAIKVASKHNISPARVTQILRRGNAKGLFKYPPEKPDPLSHIIPEKLKTDYILYGSIDKLAAHYGVTPEEAKNSAKKHNISIIKIYIKQIKKRLVEDYKKILIDLGHHPTTTELQRVSRNLYSRILYNCGSIDNFRKTYGYRVHIEGIPKRVAYIKLPSEINRKKILRYLKRRSGVTRADIVRALGIGGFAARTHLIKLMHEGIVYKVRKGYLHYYFFEKSGAITKRKKRQ